MSLGRIMTGKVLLQTEIHLTCVRNEPTVFSTFSLKSSHIYCSPERLWKRQTVINGNGVLQRAGCFHFNSKPWRLQTFSPGIAPDWRLVCVCFLNVNTEEQWTFKKVRHSSGMVIRMQRLKEKWPILHRFHKGALESDALGPQDHH
jgi:hypothetical protein